MFKEEAFASSFFCSNDLLDAHFYISFLRALKPTEGMKFPFCRKKSPPLKSAVITRPCIYYM